MSKTEDDRKIYDEYEVELFFSDDAKGINLDLRSRDGIIEVADLVEVLRAIADDFASGDKELFDEDESIVH